MNVAVIDDTFLLKTYRGAARLLGPVLPFWVRRRAAQGKEDPSRLAERQGISEVPRPAGKGVWMHGASVGECTMLLPLIHRMRKARPDLFILVTSATRTAANLMHERLPSGCIHQYSPLDDPRYVSAFLDHWQPSAAIWAESEIWPNLILACKRRGIKTALINARMSERSISGWSKRRASAKAVFTAFDRVIAADEPTARALELWTGDQLKPAGNLKEAALPLPAETAQVERLQKCIGARPVWCAASTHKGEDAIVLKAHEHVRQKHPNAALILAPRHPERAPEIVDQIQRAGLRTAQRSKAERPDARTDVYLFDTIGELGLAYSLSGAALICGSLLDGLSGHNPLEPALLGSAIVSGPHISSFSDIYSQLSAAGGAHILTAEKKVGAKDIADEISRLIAAASLADQRSRKAREFAQSRNSVLAHTWTVLLPLLPEAAP